MAQNGSALLRLCSCLQLQVEASIRAAWLGSSDSHDLLKLDVIR